MTLGDFLWDRLGRLVLLLAAGAGSILFLSLTGTQPGILAILGLVWAILFLAMQAVDFLKCRGRLLELEGEQGRLENAIAEAEIPAPAVERDFIVYWLTRFRGGSVGDAEARRDVVESLIHSLRVWDDHAEAVLNYAGEEKAVNVPLAPVDGDGGGSPYEQSSWACDHI